MATLRIMCVDCYNFDRVMRAWKFFGDIRFRRIMIRSVADMVWQLEKETQQGKKIGELWIVGHGGPLGQFIGADALTLKTVERLGPTLSRLRPLFAQGAVVTLWGCEAGKEMELLARLSWILRVHVRGFTAKQDPITPGFEGEEVWVKAVGPPGQRK